MTFTDDWIDQNVAAITGLSDAVWDLSEMSFEEDRSSRMVADFLAGHGFEVEFGVGGITTAFHASWCAGQGPSVGLLGEYDALAGVSQEAGLDHPQPRPGTDAGHGCGHNLLGAASAAAAVATTQHLEGEGLPGSVHFFGCPAEENGSAKAFMAREGVFDGVDAFLTWHTFSMTAPWTSSSLANIQAIFRFHGKAAHAAQSPHLGRSALDAVELMNVGANYLREHIVPESRLHYAVTNSGGRSPNVVPALAEVLYLVRAPRMEVVEDIYARLQDVARGAALMTGTTVDIVFDKACSSYLPNMVLTEVVAEELLAVGPPRWDYEDRDLAQRIKAGFGPAQLAGHAEQAESFMGPDDDGLVQRDLANPLSEVVLPFRGAGTVAAGSTDVGDVSRVAPTAQFAMAGLPIGAALHSWQAVSVGRTGIGHKSEVVAAKVLARTATRLMTDDQLRARATAEHARSMNGQAYRCPVPPEVSPYGEQGSPSRNGAA
ncbi:p-aminobenzoyl-glutamate hydrolase subunit AbgB [Luteococcus sediminum]